MATLFPDYQQMIMRAYELKKVNNMLPHGLMHLTPAQLKDECIKKCTKDVNKRDEKVIRDFCGDLSESKNCYTIIQRCETDKFRPLVNYLRGRSDSTEVKNIELLAWLIDFSGRPWEMGKTITGDEGINEGAGTDDGGQTSEEQETRPGTITDPSATTDGRDETGVPIILKKRTVKPTQRLTAAVMLSLVLGTGGMWWWKDINQPRPLSGSCMYWHEDHYEHIACNQKVPNAMVIALDTMKLTHLKKITRPDTITYQAMGKVWYSKINGKLEYYTFGGQHPVVFGRQLRPITAYIIDKYILSGTVTSSN